MGILIAIEGTDGSGKATQTQMLYKRLLNRGFNVRQLSFPCYDSPSSALVKMYLGSEFGNKPEDVNPYAASTFYAVDRYASYMKDWKQFYDDGGIVLCDRYTISNAIHQGAKLDEQTRAEYLKWLYHFEYELMGIPAPDIVFFLAVSPELSWAMKAEREASTNTKADLHEQHKDYLKHCYEVSMDIAGDNNWQIVNCTEHGEFGERMKAIETINNDILYSVIQYIAYKQ